MCRVEHCSSVPISLCGFQVTELALTEHRCYWGDVWRLNNNYYYY